MIRLRIAHLLQRSALRVAPLPMHPHPCGCSLHRAYRTGHAHGFHAAAKESARREYLLARGFSLPEMDRLETLAGERRAS